MELYFTNYFVQKEDTRGVSRTNSTLDRMNAETAKSTLKLSSFTLLVHFNLNLNPLI